MSQRRTILVCLFMLIGFYGIWGIRWGLPSDERTALFLNPALNNAEFFSKVEKARDDLYSKMGGNHVAYFGRLAKIGEINNLPTLLNSYSSYLVKTHAMDEAATLVMLSHINPLKNRWYPYAFAYGGAYLFPLGVYLACLHVLHAIRLVPSASFYYMHPGQIAKVYTATRLWSVCGLLAATLAIYCLAEKLIGGAPAVWAALFFGLAPTCLAHTKLAKPHTWAAAFSLWGIYFAIQSKETEEDNRAFIFSAIFFGLALGTTVTQIVFVPFLAWALLSKNVRRMVTRGTAALAIMASLYLSTNFYLLAHVQDYLDEQYFLKQFAPFQARLMALWDFIDVTLRLSLGWELWLLSMAGLVWALIQHKKRMLRPTAALLLVAVVYVAFQTQAQSGAAYTSRLFLGMIGLLAIFASGVTFDWGGFGSFCRWGCLAILLVKGAVMNEHFRSDKAPFDNASKTALWIRQNIPVQSVVAESQTVPHSDFFPPIDFSRYRIVQINSPEFKQSQGIVYAVISGKEAPWRDALLKNHFALIQRFNTSPLQRLGFEDPFTNANFSLEIYARDFSQNSHA